MQELDTIDRKILRELRNSARISNVDLANKVGLSASACLRRVQEMERADLITGYHARINRRQTGRGFLAYISVGLSNHSKLSQAGFERAMSGAPQVVECHNITGTFEYLLRVEVADIDRYKEFHTEILGAHSGVNSITSHIVMSSPKDERG